MKFNMLTLAIKCIHFATSQPDITQKPKHCTDELKQRLTDTWDRIPQDIINEASGKYGCLHV